VALCLLFCSGNQGAHLGTNRSILESKASWALSGRRNFLDQPLAFLGSGRCGHLGSASPKQAFNGRARHSVRAGARRAEDCPPYLLRFEKIRDRGTRSPARQRRALPQLFAIVRFFQIKYWTDGNDPSRINLSVRHVIMALDVIEIDRVRDAWLLI
jgi:hypothetical protein